MCKTSPTEEFLIASNSSVKGRLSRVLTASQNSIPNTLAASPAFAPPPARTKQAMGTSGPLQPPKRRSDTGRRTARRCDHRQPPGLSLPRAAPMEAARLMLTDTVQDQTPSCRRKIPPRLLMLALQRAVRGPCAVITPRISHQPTKGECLLERDPPGSRLYARPRSGTPALAPRDGNWPSPAMRLLGICPSKPTRHEMGCRSASSA